MHNSMFPKMEELELFCVLRLLIRKLWLIVMAALIGVMGSVAILTALVSQTYSTSVTFAVVSRAYGGNGYASVTVATEVAEIYSELLSGEYMNEIIRESAGNVTGTITAAQLGETNLIQVTVTSQSPKDALKILQVVMEKQDSISAYVSSIAVLNPIDSLNIVMHTTRDYNIRRMAVLGGLLGAALMAALLVLIHSCNMTIKNRTGAKNNLDGRLLTTVPHEALPSGGGKNQPERPLLITQPLVGFGFTEAVSRITALFEHENAAGRKVFVFTSVYEGEGKSTLAANTALSLAGKSSRVLMIDLDLRSPVQYRIFGETVEPQNELSRLLSQAGSARQILDHTVVSPGSELHLLLATGSNTAAVHLLSGELLKQLLELARQQFDYVIIDTPPLSFFADSQSISDLADGSVLVVRQDVAPAPEINDAMDALRAGKSEFLGYILNDMQYLLPGSSEYGYRYGSRYYGRYGKYGKYGKYGRYGRYGGYASGHGKYEKTEKEPTREV